MPTDVKLSNTQISKIIQSGGSFGLWLANLGKKALTNIAILLAWYNLLGLVSNWTSDTINGSERKVSGKGAVRARKGFTLFTSNENTKNIIKIIESLQDSGALTDGVNETVKQERQPGFTYSVCGPFTNIVKDFKNLEEEVI